MRVEVKSLVDFTVLLIRLLLHFVQILRRLFALVASSNRCSRDIFEAVLARGRGANHLAAICFTLVHVRDHLLLFVHKVSLPDLLK